MFDITDAVRAVARQTGLRAVQIETDGLASVGSCYLFVILGRIFGFKTCLTLSANV